MGQSQQFLEAITGVDEVRTSLDGARFVCRVSGNCEMELTGIYRMRNHDILTSLDVLTTGTYQRLPSIIKVSQPPANMLHVHVF